MPGQVSRKSMPTRSASVYDGLTGIPSGVSHGSALPVVAAAATGAKATVLKSGMPLIPLFLKLTVPLDRPQTQSGFKSITSIKRCKLLKFLNHGPGAGG